MAQITNMKGLENIVNKYIVKAMELTRDEIFEAISQKISDYYNEDVFEHSPTDIPDYYDRTGKLVESLTASHITKNGNMFEFRVGWDDDYLTFRYPGGFVKRGSNGSFNKATGLQVLNWFNSSSHGGNVSGSHDYWDEAISELGGEQGIINRFKNNCKRVGMPIMN